MRPCLNQITISRQAPQSDPALAGDMRAVREAGWDALEVWLRHWDQTFATAGLPGARRLLDDSGLVASGACAQPGLFFSTGEDLQRFQDELDRRLEQCQALGAPHLVITPGTPGKQLPETPSVAALDEAAIRLRAAGDLAARYGVVLGIEFLKLARFVNNLPTALMLARQVQHPNVGVLVDTFHLYAGLSKVEDLDLLQSTPQSLTFVHVNDVPAGVPRELLTDAHRVLPGEGAFPLPAIFDRLRRLQYAGYVSLELFDDAFSARWAQAPVETARAARRSVDRLLAPAQAV
jgi:sugar phosphate isomerase/epimerase